MQKRNFNSSILFTFIIIMLSIVMFYSFPKFAYCQECSFDVTLYDKEYKNTNCTLNDLLKNKTFTFFELTGNNETDKDIFKHFQNAVHLLSKSKDTIKGVHFKFNKSTNYQNFVDVFDVCAIEGVLYIYNNDDLWIMKKPKVRTGSSDIQPISL